MGKPKRHHTNPRFLLNGFTDEQGVLHYLDKASTLPNIHRSRPKDAFISKNTYSFKDAKQQLDASLEMRLSDEEGRSAGVIKNLMKCSGNCLPPTIDSDQKSTIAAFVYLQWQRGDDFMDPIVKSVPYRRLVDRTVSTCQAIGQEVPEDEIERLIERKESLLQKSKVLAISDPNADVISLLGSLDVVVAHAHCEESFVIGSNPVVALKKVGANCEYALDGGIWLPISSKAAVVFHKDHRVQGSILPLNCVREVRRINDRTFGQSTQVAARSRELLHSLRERCDYRI